ncbi:Uncharacterized protein TCM_037967 [Theobroma cacao]|uniref:Uncharacterized protein n=1 Tax=Theobroma cacao TaxID=3641 RepID=A0A061GM16_THECC|nr:Uncharacterized protein TCM_037967 [Theobroma cacao]
MVCLPSYMFNFPHFHLSFQHFNLKYPFSHSLKSMVWCCDERDTVAKSLDNKHDKRLHCMKQHSWSNASSYVCKVLAE